MVLEPLALDRGEQVKVDEIRRDRHLMGGGEDSRVSALIGPAVFARRRGRTRVRTSQPSQAGLPSVDCSSSTQRIALSIRIPQAPSR